MPRFYMFSFICFFGVVSLANAAQLRLKVEGLSGELEKNVRVTLSTIKKDEVNNNGRFRAQVDKAIRQGLRALGYYQPIIEFDFQERKAPERSLLIARVTKGEPILIAGTRINIQGEAEDDPDYQKLVRNEEPKLGAVLNHGTYDHFKDSLTSLALHKGYFDANIRVHQLGVIENKHQAFWNIDFNSGQRYRFGQVSFQGSQIREDYLQGLLPFKPGDYYISENLAKLNQHVSGTNWFKSVVVSPDFNHATADKWLPVEVLVVPRDRNAVELGGGYATDVGSRIKASWNRPWINSRGQSLTASINFSAPEQIVDLSYKVPLRKDPLGQYYLFQGGVKREKLNDTEADSTTFNVARYWESTNDWQRAMNLRWSLDHFTQGEVTDTTQLVYPGISINRTRSQGGLMPAWGDSQRYSLDVSSTVWGSDISFAVIQLQNVWIQTLAQKHRFMIRGNVGWIETRSFDRMPPSLRFFAGGDRSIRGYKYKSISPRDDEGKLTGASKMVTGSLEYQYNITGKWWGATFIDSGEAVNDFKRSNFHTGAGLGVRWESPVGPIKFDLAVPVGKKEADKLQFYIGLGPEL